MASCISEIANGGSVMAYFIVAVSNFYLYRASKEEGALPLHNTSPSQQHLVAEIQRPGTAHVRGTGGDEEPPPPYTATATPSEMTILTPSTSLPTLNSMNSTVNATLSTPSSPTLAPDVVVSASVISGDALGRTPP
jgi:hypothetical protein